MRTKKRLTYQMKKNKLIFDGFCSILFSDSKVVFAIREWRKGGGLQPGMATQPLHDAIPSPTVSASRKKQKTSQSIASLSLGAPSPALHTTMQPSSSALRHAPTPRSKSKKTKPVS